MGDATVNGDMPKSSFIDHVTSYPAVSDGISFVKDNPYGAKGIDLTNAAYSKFVKPTLPYLEKPASYAAPYVAKVDQLGDSFLSKVDEKVPMVKSETQEIKGTVMDTINWPMKKAGETKDFALSTYSDEYKKCGGNGVFAGGKAAVTTSLILSSEYLKWLSSFLQAKKEEAKEVVQEKTS